MEYTTTSPVGEICVYYMVTHIGLILVNKCSETLVRFSGHAKQFIIDSMGVRQVVWTIRTGLRGSFVFLKKLGYPLYI